MNEEYRERIASEIKRLSDKTRSRVKPFQKHEIYYKEYEDLLNQFEMLEVPIWSTSKKRSINILEKQRNALKKFLDKTENKKYSDIQRKIKEVGKEKDIKYSKSELETKMQEWADVEEAKNYSSRLSDILGSQVIGKIWKNSRENTDIKSEDVNKVLRDAYKEIEESRVKYRSQKLKILANKFDSEEMADIFNEEFF